MLGSKIRDLRKSQNLKLNEVSQESGLSVSYISQLERDLVEPSLSSLKKIATALKTPIYMLIDDGEHGNILMEKSNRLKMSFSNSDTSYEIISATTDNNNFVPKMMMAEFFLPASGEDSDDYISHSAEEIIMIYEGEIDVWYGDEHYVLSEGDSIYIQENIPHRIVNKSSKDARGYYIVTPAYMPKNS